MNVSARLDEESARLARLGSALEARHRLQQEVREFFTSRDFLEVETPVRVQAPALEEHINCPAGDEQSRLRPSPELHMKRLLAALVRPLFQLGPCFRQDERGPLHLPEFTMLEWYRPHADCMNILQDTVELLRYCVKKITGQSSCRFRNQRIDLAAEWQVQSVDNAFAEHADLSVDQAVEQNLFEQILVEQVLPRACGEKPLVLYGFPLSLDSLAERDPETGRAKRWELFLAGIEIANAYTELTDYDEQARRFQNTAQKRIRENKPLYPIDAQYLEILRQGFPPCAGIALGFERLLMVLLGCNDITQITAFPPELERTVEVGDLT